MRSELGGPALGAENGIMASILGGSVKWCFITKKESKVT